MKNTFIFFIIILMLSIYSSCRHELMVTNNPSVSEVCNEDTVYFEKDVLPIILSNCAMSGCHNATDKADGIILVDYKSILSDGRITPYQPTKSKLYKSIIDNDPEDRMPLDMPPLKADLVEKIKVWIEQGARNNNCIGCDTIGTISYSQHIVPILQTHCYGCHNTNNTLGDLDLTTYTKVKPIADDGSLYGSISHQSGYAPMPQGASKLSECNLSIINKWIQNGAKNN